MLACRSHRSYGVYRHNMGRTLESLPTSTPCHRRKWYLLWKYFTIVVYILKKMRAIPHRCHPTRRTSGDYYSISRKLSLSLKYGQPLWDGRFLLIASILLRTENTFGNAFKTRQAAFRVRQAVHGHCVSPAGDHVSQLWPSTIQRSMESSRRFAR